ncbi:MAG: EpsG family protein [Lachnospiraceae bacterium]|nr:EpsG family protein [Lachnospiraceae bacterium]
MISYLQYFLIAIIIIVLTKINICFPICVNKKRCNFIGWFFEWFILTFLASVRCVGDNFGGADAANYAFYYFRDGNVDKSEKLFYYIGIIVRKFTDNYHIYFFVIYGIIVFSFLFFAYKIFKEDVSFAELFLYANIYVSSYGIMRQWLAISIMMVAVILTTEKKYKSAIIVSIFSVFIHTSMILIVVILAGVYVLEIFSIQINSKTLLLLALMCNLVSFCGQTIIKQLISKTDYIVYLDLEYSWLGYIPAIVFMIVFLLFGDVLAQKHEGDKIVIYFIFANLALVYIAVALGMFRVMVVFIPIRIYAVYLLKESFLEKIVIGNGKYSIMNLLYSIVIFLDGCLLMWRTIAAGALPLVVTV